MLLQDLHKKDIIHPPSWLPDNTMYLVQMRSTAYGVAEKDSDLDIYGFCIPHKDIVFPHLRGEIQGFGRQTKRFEQWQEHHIKDEEKEYDFSVFSIVKYFQLVMECNPTQLDSLFVPQRCIIHNSQIAEMVRENRNIFLSKKCWHTYKGYAYSQVSKMKNRDHKHLKKLIELEDEFKIPRDTTLEEAANACISKDFNGNPMVKKLSHLSSNQVETYYELYQKMVKESVRSEGVKIYGIDRKFAYHVVRLLLECEQILTEGTLVLDEKGRREQMKAIRNGEWTKEQIEDFFEVKRIQLEKLYQDSKIPHSPDEDKIKELLLNCLEHHYGSLEKCIEREDKIIRAFRQISGILKELKM